MGKGKREQGDGGLRIFFVQKFFAPWGSSVYLARLATITASNSSGVIVGCYPALRREKAHSFSLSSGPFPASLLSFPRSLCTATLGSQLLWHGTHGARYNIAHISCDGEFCEITLGKRLRMGPMRVHQRQTAEQHTHSYSTALPFIAPPCFFLARGCFLLLCVQTNFPHSALARSRARCQRAFRPVCPPRGTLLISWEISVCVCVCGEWARTVECSGKISFIKHKLKCENIAHEIMSQPFRWEGSPPLPFGFWIL